MRIKEWQEGRCLPGEFRCVLFCFGSTFLKAFESNWFVGLLGILAAEGCVKWKMCIQGKSYLAFGFYLWFFGSLV